ncbi:MAG: helical backbone metal receptor [Gemmatimonadota bacterium]|nr:helical backbone metal receptor [Gemmatimonadota bacterium]
MRRRPPPGRLRRALTLMWATTSLVCVVATGCTSGEVGDREVGAAGWIRVTDASGVAVTLPAPAQRVVSLVPSATQTLRAIGADGALVGRTDFDNQPWAAAIQSVGGGLEPNLESIVALEPDLVIRFGGSQDPRTPRRLDDLGIAHIAVRPDQVDDIYQTTLILGAVTGHERAADSLVASIRRDLEDLSAKAATLRRHRVAYVLGGTPPFVSGPGTYIDEIVSLVGGDNVFGDLRMLYSSVSPEELLTRDIEVVLHSGADNFDATLTPGARVIQVGDILEIPGPDVVEAAYYIAEMLHGRSLR